MLGRNENEKFPLMKTEPSCEFISSFYSFIQYYFLVFQFFFHLPFLKWHSHCGVRFKIIKWFGLNVCEREVKRVRERHKIHYTQNLPSSGTLLPRMTIDCTSINYEIFFNFVNVCSIFLVSIGIWLCAQCCSLSLSRFTCCSNSYWPYDLAFPLRLRHISLAIITNILGIFTCFSFLLSR